MGREASAAVLEHGFRRAGLPDVPGLTHPDNMSARRMLESLGFVYQHDEHCYGQPRPWYRLARERFERLQASRAR